LQAISEHLDRLKSTKTSLGESYSMRDRQHSPDSLSILILLGPAV